MSISGSPITGSGTFNISGAGSSSQVILGDLTLATLTSGTVTSVALTESGTALSISGSPITGSGTFNIAGAGTSSQVILGDLSLGTLTSGTVTSVSSSQAFITIADPTTTPSISIGNASGAATGVLTAADWTTFNGKQDSITLTTTGSSGAATLVGSTLNIPQYSGGGGIGGSITDNQVSVGATTADEIEGYSDFTYDNSLDTLTVGEKIESSGTSQLKLIAGSSSISILDSGVANHINISPASGRINAQSSTLSVGTGSADTTISSNGAYNLTLNTNDGTNSGSIVITDGVNGQISITPNGTGTIKLDGVEIDNSAIATGYVLKASSASAAGWAAESGGGTDNTPGIPTGNADLYQEWLGFGGQAGLVGAGNSNVVSYQWANTATRIRPHVISKTGTLGVAAINVTAVPTTVTAQEVRIGLYKSDSDGGVGDLKAVATISVSASTGVLTGSYVAETGEDLSVTRGELYWAGFYSTYASAADAMTVSMNATNSLPTMRLDLDTTPIAGQTYWKTGDFPEPYTAGSNPSDGQGQTWLMMGTTIT